MISERQNDGIERAREAWFRRANRAEPERGGAPKSRTFHGREWMEHARERWAALTNAKLERRGRDERVDHRSYERQGIDREPGHHYGPRLPHTWRRVASSTTASTRPLPTPDSTTPSERSTTTSTSSKAATTAAAEAG